MKVREVMRKDVETCSVDATLSDAARVMWERNCGLVPILEGDRGQLVGVVTDRDVCMAAWSKGMPLGAIPVTVPMSSELRCCGPEDDLEQAHKAMRAHRVKRLLVMDKDQKLVGVVSLAALARAASHGKSKEAQATKPLVAETLAAFAEPRAQRVTA